MKINLKNINLKLLKSYLKNSLVQKILLILISTLLTLLILYPFYSFLNNLSYDLMMKYIKKPIKQNDSLLLVDIDDNAMNFIPYRWQWPRYIHGDAVEVLADFGAKAVVYDIEFLGKSAPGVNIAEIENIKKNIENNFSNIYDDYVKSTTIISNDPSAKSRLQSTWNNFNANIYDYYKNVNSSIDRIVRDNDEYFAKRLKYYGKAYGTVNMLFDKNLSKKELDKNSTKENLSRLEAFGFKKNDLLKKRKNHPSLKPSNIAEFATDQVLEGYKEVGFTKVERDKDAAIRFIDLFMENNNYEIPQLALAPFLDIYNIKPEMIDLSGNGKVIFKNVKINDKTKDIKIPVVDGSMLINWPSGDFSEIFVNKKTKIDGRYYHFSYLGLLSYKTQIENFGDQLKNTLDNIEEKEAKNIYNEYKFFMDAKKTLVEKGTLTDEIRKDMNSALDDILNKIIIYTSADNINKKTKEIDAMIYSNNSDKKLVNEMINIKNNLAQSLNKLNNDASTILQNRIALQDILENKICFIGLTATGTTDLGSNPFDKKFSNVGTHPSVFNTILQNDFIYILPIWLIILLSLLIISSGIWILINKDAVVISTTGAVTLTAVLFIVFIIYRLTNIYITPIIPIFSIAVSFTALTVIKFIITEKDKSFIKDAFDRYLSPEVIKELLKDPSKLVLGGERKNCTAVFTDIEGFSSISEKFRDDPPGLVTLLNKYLSAMSDIILENQGTIDKYEGDAIIAFYGAPHNFPDHPHKACLSTIRMKQLEDGLNKKFLEDKIIDKPLKTRIGINTGDMFVGNMGTTRKFNYTMMGHNVNLAARIEGVNKLYGTYAMLSENTYEFIKDEFVCRKMDRVRVVNINTPIRLFELVSLKSELDPTVKEKLEAFDEGLIEFEKQNWDKAVKLFKKASLNPEWDKAVELYIDRCKKFLKTPPAANWDGVYNMSTK